MVSNVTRLKLKVRPFGDSVILRQDRCTVCFEHIIGLETILDPPDGTPR
jgi:hypothetical protein